jgi:hypothetical protein
VSPPSPRRTESPKTSAVTTAWTLAMIRLHVAPSAYCDSVTTPASTLQISHVPRWGRVDPPRTSRTYGIVSAIPIAPASKPRTGANSIISGAASRRECSCACDALS